MTPTYSQRSILRELAVRTTTARELASRLPEEEALHVRDSLLELQRLGAVKGTPSRRRTYGRPTRTVLWGVTPQGLVWAHARRPNCDDVRQVRR